ncbi:MAG: HAD family hydrolase [Ilumatobacteraceae bacterium]
MASSIDLIVTDLDGTLWERPSELHPRVVTALADLDGGDVDLLVATGRRVGSARDTLAAVGLAPPAVVLNGALGLDLGSSTRFHLGGYERTDAADVLAAFTASGVEPCLHIDHDRWPVRVGTDPSTHPLHLASFGEDVATSDLEQVVADEHVLAFGVLGLDGERAVELGSALGDVRTTAHVDRDRAYGGHHVSAGPAGQSKWDGVRVFCARHGLDESAVLAIGDGQNDVEMLTAAAVAVAPEDAHPDVLACADHVFGRAADGGWADVLELVANS